MPSFNNAAGGELDVVAVTRRLNALEFTLSPAGGYPPPVSGTVTSDATTARTAIDIDAGKYIRFTNAAAKTFTFDSAQTFTIGSEFIGRNAGAGNLTLTAANSFVLNAPYGASLVVPNGGTFGVKIISASQADVFGMTL